MRSEQDEIKKWTARYRQPTLRKLAEE